MGFGLDPQNTTLQSSPRFRVAGSRSAACCACTGNGQIWIECARSWEGTVKRRGVVALMGCLAASAGAWGQKPPLLPEKDVAALANELSGETAKRNLEGIAQFHRQRGSQGFHAAAELVAERLRAYGLSDVAILQFPAGGKIFYGTQRSRPAWNAEKGELTEINIMPPVCNNGTVENKSLNS